MIYWNYSEENETQKLVDINWWKWLWKIIDDDNDEKIKTQKLVKLFDKIISESSEDWKKNSKFRKWKQQNNLKRRWKLWTEERTK